MTKLIWAVFVAQWRAIICYVAVLVPDKRCINLVFFNRASKIKSTTFHPGLVLPSGGDGSPLVELWKTTSEVRGSNPIHP